MKKDDFKPNISVVLPILNEAGILSATISTIQHILPRYSRKWEIIAVNDGSTDATEVILSQFQKDSVNLRVKKHSANRGYGAALRTGIQNARHSWILFTDADLQFNIEEIAQFLPYTSTHDLIVGYRRNRADSFRRKFISYFYNKFIHFLFGLPLKDVDCAFKLMRRSAVARVPFTSNSFFVSVELMVKSRKQGLRIKELGVRHYPRRAGKSTVTYKRIWQSVLDLSRLYRNLSRV